MKERQKLLDTILAELNEGEKDKAYHSGYCDGVSRIYEVMNRTFPTEDDTTDTHNVIPNNDAAKHLADGVYLIYEDHIELYDGSNPKDNVQYVGIVMGSRTTAIALHDLGGKGKEYALVPDTDKCEKGWDGYTRNRINAFEDFDGRRGTEHIKSCGSEIPFDQLKPGEFLPSLGSMGIWMMHATKLNEALEYVGGDPLEGCYWTVTECNSTGAWYVYFNDGRTYGSIKCSSCVVRPEVAFPSFF